MAKRMVTTAKSVGDGVYPLFGTLAAGTAMVLTSLLSI